MEAPAVLTQTNVRSTSTTSEDMPKDLLSFLHGVESGAGHLP